MAITLNTPKGTKIRVINPYSALADVGDIVEIIQVESNDNLYVKFKVAGITTSWKASRFEIVDEEIEKPSFDIFSIVAKMKGNA